MNCVLVNRAQIESGFVTLGQRESTHILEVLGKKPGDHVLAGIIDGPIGLVPVLDVQDGVRIGIPTGDVPPVPPVDLILAMPRPKVMKRLWAPLASIGVHRIFIIGAERVESFYFESHAVMPSVYEPLLKEGLEQARDTRMPEVKVVKNFTWFTDKHLPSWAGKTIRLLGQPGACQSVKGVINPSQKNTRAALAVGPEGGWTTGEIDTFAAHGFVPVGMRDRALRTDTAIISLLALIYEAM